MYVACDCGTFIDKLFHDMTNVNFYGHHSSIIIGISLHYFNENIYMYYIINFYGKAL